MTKFQETALNKYFKEDIWNKIWIDDGCDIITDYCSAVRMPAEYKFDVKGRAFIDKFPEILSKHFKTPSNKRKYETVKKPTKDEIKASGWFYQFNDKYAVDGKRLRKLFDAVGGAVEVRIPIEDYHAPVYVLGKNGDGFLLPLRVVPQQ